jgi:hypothetical protein
MGCSDRFGFFRHGRFLDHIGLREKITQLDTNRSCVMIASITAMTAYRRQKRKHVPPKMRPMFRSQRAKFM